MTLIRGHGPAVYPQLGDDLRLAFPFCHLVVHVEQPVTVEETSQAVPAVVCEPVPHVQVEQLGGKKSGFVSALHGVLKLATVGLVGHEFVEGYADRSRPRSHVRIADVGESLGANGVGDRPGYIYF